MINLSDRFLVFNFYLLYICAAIYEGKGNNNDSKEEIQSRWNYAMRSCEITFFSNMSCTPSHSDTQI